MSIIIAGRLRLEDCDTVRHCLNKYIGINVTFAIFLYSRSGFSLWTTRIATLTQRTREWGFCGKDSVGLAPVPLLYWKKGTPSQGCIQLLCGQALEGSVQILLQSLQPVHISTWKGLKLLHFPIHSIFALFKTVLAMRRFLWPEQHRGQLPCSAVSGLNTDCLILQSLCSY